jgi:hypothetical protein
MAVFKIKRIDSKFVEKTYPDLFSTLEKIEGLEQLQKQKLYSLCIDIAEKSQGSARILFNEEVEETDFIEDYPQY